MVYHVTDRDISKIILREGFSGGWGDIGYGVYFYGTINSARAYLEDGGWGGELKDPVIIGVNDSDIEKITPFDLDSSWEPEKYADMYWHPMEEEDDDVRWVPNSMMIVK